MPDILKWSRASDKYILRMETEARLTEVIDNDNDNENIFITIDLHIYKIQDARYKYTDWNYKSWWYIHSLDGFRSPLAFLKPFKCRLPKHLVLVHNGPFNDAIEIIIGPLQALGIGGIIHC